MVRPSVLDGRLSAAFYTAPAGSLAGATVDLRLRDDEPWQELVHPAIEFTVEHLWAVDVITASVGDALSATRGHHALKLCGNADSDFVDLCGEVDGDLI